MESRVDFVTIGQKKASRIAFDRKGYNTESTVQQLCENTLRVRLHPIANRYGCEQPGLLARCLQMEKNHSNHGYHQGIN